MTDFSKWLKYAGVRALKTFAQTASSMLIIGTTGILEVDWINILSVSTLSAIVSLLTSIAGLPELESEEIK